MTRILQPSLGGNARTAIICTLSPARAHVEQSKNTLLFAGCAKEVVTNGKVNVVMSDKALVKHLQRELARLEGELRCPGTASSMSQAETLLKEKDAQIKKVITKSWFCRLVDADSWVMFYFLSLIPVSSSCPRKKRSFSSEKNTAIFLNARDLICQISFLGDEIVI